MSDCLNYTTTELEYAHRDAFVRTFEQDIYIANGEFLQDVYNYYTKNLEFIKYIKQLISIRKGESLSTMLVIEQMKRELNSQWLKKLLFKKDYQVKIEKLNKEKEKYFANFSETFDSFLKKNSKYMEEYECLQANYPYPLLYTFEADDTGDILDFLPFSAKDLEKVPPKSYFERYFNTVISESRNHISNRKNQKRYLACCKFLEKESKDFHWN